ncbi:hypothetical protein [Candidatus Laterigemmans baculatus]|uniref:hypothetical protein n=1 Tax=Candidatus Laterigemmans baculatus TaxID=2770505 RepID=UPI0013DB245C|nr:hypothetical protein [Candidatus Laterigemmans baculatus]
MRYAIRGMLAVTVACSFAFSAATADAQDQELRVESARFAPGTVRVIPPEPVPEETYTGPISLQGLIDAHPELEWSEADFPEGKPHFDARTRTVMEMAQQVILRREIFCFEFAFKPLRQMVVDIPQPNGVMERKLIWYMVYRVRYRGGDLRPASDVPSDNPMEAIYSRIEKVSYDSRRFFPMFVLTDPTSGKEYLDRILPTVTEQIKTREKITAPLHNSVSITAEPVLRTTDPAAGGVWGVVTWEDVDPQIDFLSVYVYGLTNAFKRVEENGEVELVKKALQLNFFRPGDAIEETNDRIRFGVPAYSDPQEQQYVLEKYGLDKRLDYQWLYR